MKNLKLFKLHTNYDNYINNVKAIVPNVSYCKDLKDVHYIKNSFKRQYLTITAIEDGIFIFGYQDGLDTENNMDLSYSTDNGETWVTIENNGSENTNTILVKTNDKILLKGNNDTLYNGNSSIIIRSSFKCNISGNIMSLLYNDNFLNEIRLYNTYCFTELFAYVNSSETNNLGENLINAENLILPATTLSNSCYSLMFMGCTNLTTAPELPATTLTDSCYYYMFDGCTSLTTAPELPATTLADYCYSWMFYNCTSLTTAPELPATTLTDSCYQFMFSKCTSLTTAPELPATTLVNNCYLLMFRNCTNLNYIKAMFTTAPSTTYTQNWVSGVASTGTFIKNSAATWTTTGVNGIPSGWTVQTASA